METTSRSMRRVEEALRAHGVEAVVREMPGSTRTAQDAADAVGCTVGQICKSLVLASDAGEVVLAVTSGSNRADLARLAELIGAPVQMADAGTVRGATGYAIGGVAPVGLEKDVPVWMDEDLLQYDVVWAAAGTPRSVFEIAPETLVRITGATVASFARQG